MTKLNRQAPVGGYDFPEKEVYRDRVWSTFAQGVGDVSTARAMLMPSSEGLEIPVALRYGFKEENLVCVDRDREIIKQSDWVTKYPNVKGFAAEIDNVGKRIKASGMIKCANLDLCGCLSELTLDTVTQFIRSGCLKKDSLIAVTMRNGRENEQMTGMLRIIRKLLAKRGGDEGRVSIMKMALEEILETKYNLLCSDGYLSGKVKKVKMVWGILQLGESIAKENKPLVISPVVTPLCNIEETQAKGAARKIKLIAPELIRLISIHDFIYKKFEIKGDYRLNKRNVMRSSFDIGDKFDEQDNPGSHIKLNDNQCDRLASYIVHLQMSIQRIQKTIMVIIGNTVISEYMDNIYINKEPINLRAAWHPHVSLRKSRARLSWGDSWITSYVDGEYVVNKSEESCLVRFISEREFLTHNHFPRKVKIVSETKTVSAEINNIQVMCLLLEGVTVPKLARYLNTDVKTIRSISKNKANKHIMTKRFEIIDMFKRGKNIEEISKEFGFSEYSVEYILTSFNN